MKARVNCPVLKQSAHDKDLHYRPIFSVSSGAVSGLEVSTFLPDYEGESDCRLVQAQDTTDALIHDLAALSEMLRGHIPVHMTFTAPEIEQTTFVRQCFALSERFNLARHSLVVGIAAEQPVINGSAFRQNINRTRLAGVQFYLANFGTHYSGLDRLDAFDIDGVRIDRTLTRDMSTQPDSRAIVRTLADLAHKMNIEIIAEGIVEVEQRALLHTFGISEYQCGALQPLNINELKNVVRMSNINLACRDLREVKHLIT